VTDGPRHCAPGWGFERARGCRADVGVARGIANDDVSFSPEIR
jgi:hypothetical protein